MRPMLTIRVRVDLDELRRILAYWRPSRWILSRLYARRWNRRRGLIIDLVHLAAGGLNGAEGLRVIEETLHQPNPLLAGAEWSRA